jgi:hypothetical protein
MTPGPDTRSDSLPSLINLDRDAAGNEVRGGGEAHGPGSDDGDRKLPHLVFSASTRNMELSDK